MMRDGRFLQAERNRQLLHGALALSQQADDPQAALIRHRLEESE